VNARMTATNMSCTVLYVPLLLLVHTTYHCGMESLRYPLSLSLLQPPFSFPSFFVNPLPMRLLCFFSAATKTVEQGETKALIAHDSGLPRKNIFPMLWYRTPAGRRRLDAHVFSYFVIETYSITVFACFMNISYFCECVPPIILEVLVMPPK
jgi:hypothetical protein